MSVIMFIEDISCGTDMHLKLHCIQDMQDISILESWQTLFIPVVVRLTTGRSKVRIPPGTH